MIGGRRQRLLLLLWPLNGDDPYAEAKNDPAVRSEVKKTLSNRSFFQCWHKYKKKRTLAFYWTWSCCADAEICLTYGCLKVFLLSRVCRYIFVSIFTALCALMCELVWVGAHLRVSKIDNSMLIKKKYFFSWHLLDVCLAKYML